MNRWCFYLKWLTKVQFLRATIFIKHNERVEAKLETGETREMQKRRERGLLYEKFNVTDVWRKLAVTRRHVEDTRFNRTSKYCAIVYLCLFLALKPGVCVFQFLTHTSSNTSCSQQLNLYSFNYHSVCLRAAGPYGSHSLKHSPYFWFSRSSSILICANYCVSLLFFLWICWVFGGFSVNVCVWTQSITYFTIVEADVTLRGALIDFCVDSTTYYCSCSRVCVCVSYTVRVCVCVFVVCNS